MKIEGETAVFQDLTIQGPPKLTEEGIELRFPNGDIEVIKGVTRIKANVLTILGSVSLDDITCDIDAVSLNIEGDFRM